MGLLNFFGAIWELVKSAWDWITKIVLSIISFVKNIKNFFTKPERLEKLRQNKKIIAATVKEKLDNGDYNVVNCLFDTEEGDLVDAEYDAQIMSANQMDAETKRNFGDKDMIILK